MREGKRLKDCQPWGLLHNLAGISASLNSGRKEAGETGDIRADGRVEGQREDGPREIFSVDSDSPGRSQYAASVPEAADRW